MLLALYVHNVTAFGTHQTIPILSKKSSYRGSKSSSSPSTSSIRMYIDTPDIEIPSFQPLSAPAPSSSAPAISSSILSATTEILAPNPHTEAEILSDVLQDLSPLFSPNTAVIRLLTLVGRVLLLSSDYIQHQYLSPDEWVFQLCMLAFSTQSFIRSARPIISASMISNSTLTVRDRKAYSLLFDIVGLSTLQFKTLLSSNVLEWKELDADEEIELNGDIYWLYSGGLRGAGDCLNSPSKSISSRIFGEVHFARKLQDSLHITTSKKNKIKKVEESTEMAPEDYSSNSTLLRKIHAGQDGAVLLRISTTKLLELMNDDNELSVSVQRLVLLCMQEKLSRPCCEEDKNKKRSSIPVVT